MESLDYPQNLLSIKISKFRVGTEIWIWNQFNKSKPFGETWNVTLTKDNYELLIDAITTVARDTGTVILSNYICVKTFLDQKNTGGPNIAGSFLAKKIGNIGTFGDIGHFRRYGKKKLFRSKNKKRVGVGNDVICQTIF